MISFKSFIHAIHDAIINASDSLMDKNVGLLDKYFEETTREEKDENGVVTTKSILEPKTVILEYPTLRESVKVGDNGNGYENSYENTEVHVPLITLVPLQMSQIEKAVLTADFDMEIVNGEIELNFTNRKSSEGFMKKKAKTTRGRLEITISPLETSEGLKLLVEGYESTLKRQIT